jgi:hypothetical protein
MKIVILSFGVIIASCDLMLDWNERYGYDYHTVKLYNNKWVGGFNVYYLANDGKRAEIALDNRLSGFWVKENSYFEEYSYKGGWYEYHVAEIRRDHIKIGSKKP